MRSKIKGLWLQFIGMTILGCLFINSNTGAQESSKYSRNPLIGEIDGKAVMLEDVVNKPIYDAAESLYNTLNESLMQYSIGQLAKKHPEIKPIAQVSVSDEDVKLFYEKNNLKNRGPLEQYKDQIRTYMEQQYQAEHLYLQYRLAVQKGWLKSYLEPPTEYLMEAGAKTSYLRGTPKASVMVLEFSDYQCPYCSRVQTTLREIIQKYKNEVAFGYRHFPLPFHKEADEAAIAAECAGEQGKFGELHSILFDNQRAQLPDDLKKYARQIKVQNLEKFDQCLEKETYRDRVNKDINDGQALGINGTPGFIIGRYDSKAGIVKGELLSGAQPPEKFEELIQKYLKKTPK
ncbi:thioredoxin domain-containing protein [Deltaproteobacteria bacterium TL4]